MKSYDFASLRLRPELLANLESLGFDSMTAIQTPKPAFDLKGVDVIAQGQTGSGKTAAFGLGLLNSLEPTLFKVQSLVLCPTRELAEQVSNEVRRLARTIPNSKLVTLYGGTPMKSQIDSLAKGAHIVVGTPGRIEDHLTKGSLDLANMKIFILDEADRMLDMGFQKTLDTIVELVPSKRQTHAFQRDLSAGIKSIAARITQGAELVTVAPTQDTVRIEEALLRYKTMRTDCRPCSFFYYKKALAKAWCSVILVPKHKALQAI